MEANKFLELFADQFDDTDPSDIELSSNFRELEEWDSMVALMVIAMVDEEFNVKLSGDDIRSSNTVEDILNLVKAKA